MPADALVNVAGGEVDEVNRPVCDPTTAVAPSGLTVCIDPAILIGTVRRRASVLALNVVTPVGSITSS